MSPFGGFFCVIEQNGSIVYVFKWKGKHHLYYNLEYQYNTLVIFYLRWKKSEIVVKLGGTFSSFH